MLHSLFYITLTITNWYANILILTQQNGSIKEWNNLPVLFELESTRDETYTLILISLTFLLHHLTISDRHMPRKNLFWNAPSCSSPHLLGVPEQPVCLHGQIGAGETVSHFLLLHGGYTASVLMCFQGCLSNLSLMPEVLFVGTKLLFHNDRKG